MNAMVSFDAAARWSASRALALALALVVSGSAFGQRDAPDAATGVRGAGASASAIEKRIALVIGNNAYPGAPLSGPINDARAMADALRDLGFTVVRLEDVDRAQMLKAIRSFVDDLGTAESVGLFYFAGHGAQSNGKNFLIPVDAAIRGETDIEPQSVDLQYMLDKFANMQSGMNILILDACRDNPFVHPGMKRSAGLAAIDGPPGTLVAFAAAPGHVALEVSDANGIYTKNVLANIRTPGLPIEEVFKRVRTAVLTETQRQQVPWENTSLVRDFYFRGAPPGSGFTPPTTDSEAQAWAAIEDSRNLYDFIGFLRRFPQTRYQPEILAHVNAVLAQLKPAPPPLRIDELHPLLGEAYAGFIMRAINVYSADYYGLPAPTGALVTDIDSGSMAEHAGLKPGDIILRVNGKPVRDFDEALALSYSLRAGEFVDAIVWRDRHEVAVSGVLTRAPLERLLTRVADDRVQHKDYERARAYYQYLAEGGYSLGQTDLGLVYLNGWVGPIDFKQAESWLHKAAVQGQTTAAAFLSGIYQNPQSGLVNDAEAFHWATVSAQAGVPEGASMLALAEFKGRGTVRDAADGVRWSRIAAAQGEPLAMFMLGVAYETGVGGLKPDVEEAKSWYRRSVQLGLPLAKPALERLGDH